jgi:hypothetical protein
MVSTSNHITPAIGFLTVLEHPQHGLFGGYLILNMAGRPLEFHCTAPVKANRAQQILYGPTLEAFLYGDQIGGTLLAEATIEPLAVCTDREQVLSVRDLVNVPVAVVIPAGDGSEPLLTARLTMFELGHNRLGVPHRFGDDRRLISERLREASETLDLAEPFGRIREAIEEAQQAVAR